MSPLSRRRFLTGLGGATLALPWLEKLQPVAMAQAAEQGPRRVIVVTYPMGVPLGQWRPSAVGSNFTLPHVTAPLAPFQDRCLFVSSIDNSVLDEGGFRFGHPAKKESVLTGTLTTPAFPTANANLLSEVIMGADPDGPANGPSVEQVIGTFLRRNHPRASVDLGVDGAAALRRRATDVSRTSDFFFEGAGNPVTLTLSPSAGFSDLFAGLMDTGPSEQERERQRQQARAASVLDALRDSFRELSSGLGRQDRLRLEEHAARIRQLEIDTQVSDGCVVPAAVPGVVDYAGYRMDQLATLQIRNLAHAMACELAPVGRLELTSQQDPRFGIAELDATLDGSGDYQWHAMVHGDPLPGTNTPLRPGREDGFDAYDPRLLDGYRFFVQQFADLLAELDSIQEGPETTVLDNSLVILASDLGEGLGHGHMKMGFVLAGNLGGARRGYHLDVGPDRPFEIGGGYYYADSRYNVNQLLNSVLDMAGVRDAGGAPLTMGLGGYLETAGMARRIDDLFT